MISTLEYYNVPVTMLQGYLLDPRGTLAGIADFAQWELIKFKASQPDLGAPYDEFYEEGGLNHLIALAYKAISKFIDIGDMAEDELDNHPRAFKTWALHTRNFQRHDDISGHIASMEQLKNQHNGKVYVSIPHNILWDYYKNNDKKSERDHIMLLAYLAYKSIIGTKAYCKVYNEDVFARMAGYENRNSFAAAKQSDEEALQPLLPYLTTKRAASMRARLAITFTGFEYYNQHTRGTWCTMRNGYGVTLDKLIETALKGTQAAQKSARRAMVEEARERAREAIKNEKLE